MSTTIICPNCATQFEPTDAIALSIEKEMRTKMEAEWRKRVEAINIEKQQIEAQRQELLQQRDNQEEELKRRMEIEKKAMEEALSQHLRKSISEDYDNQLTHYKRVLNEKEERIKAANMLELDYLQLKEKLLTQEQDMELKLKKSLLDEKERLQEALRKEEDERNKVRDQEYLMKQKELEKQLEDQHKLIEEMKRKAEQGSMQLQGEVQELELERILRNAFPFDVISEVGKGVRGADCIQTVRNQFSLECGKIIYESKRTKDFAPEWIEKLKADMLSQGADVAILVTQVMPKGMEQFGERDGVWICTFTEVKALAYVLRELIIKVFSTTKAQENRGDKMHILYQYLTSKEFSEQWKAIREGYMAMRISIQKERDAMERLWKSREKQLDKVMLNATSIKGSIEGITGSDVIDLNIIADDETYLLD
ncbi:MAG: DUF2130 domain-containing protein [Bacteroidota bacterium]